MEQDEWEGSMRCPALSIVDGIAAFNGITNKRPQGRSGRHPRPRLYLGATLARLCIAASTALALLGSIGYAADPAAWASKGSPLPPQARTSRFYVHGRVAVIDGRTLWFPQFSLRVRLAGIDVCELPQWAFDSERHGESKILKPVPCGAFAKAWLKRVVARSPARCAIRARMSDGTAYGTCTVRGRDLAVELLRVGWARVETPHASPSSYAAWQEHPMASQYGMWGTYVLDVDEWRRKAVDRTLSRRPIADINLLAERESEISPPFASARRHPRRTDR